MALPVLTPQQLQEDPCQQLRQFSATQKFLVALDTDGCVADNMNGKQMLVFHPHYLEFYQLWPIESYFRETAEYYNLFSVHRGCNRFLAVQYTLEALYRRPDVQKAIKETGVVLPELEPLSAFIGYCQKAGFGLSNDSLTQFLSTQPFNLYLYKLLGWSEAVNRTFPFINPRIPPFAGVREALEAMSAVADIIVVSQTPYQDLLAWWTTQGLDGFIRLIAGQEMGTKVQHIALAKEAGGYADERVLMVGDADGDRKAAVANHGLFYPITPGKETAAWQALREEYFPLFTKGAYAGEKEAALLAEFSKALLTTPAWEEEGYDHLVAYRQHQRIRQTLYANLNPSGRLLSL